MADSGRKGTVSPMVSDMTDQEHCGVGKRGDRPRGDRPQAGKDTHTAHALGMLVASELPTPGAPGSLLTASTLDCQSSPLRLRTGGESQQVSSPLGGKIWSHPDPHYITRTTMTWWTAKHSFLQYWWEHF